MKKLYFLNEEEKNRILRIHEDATKRQYLLKEESTTEGTLSDIQKIEFDDALNYDLSSPTDSNAARTPVRTIYKFCSKYNWENSLTMTKNEIDLIVARIQSSLMKGRHGSTLTGRGVSDEANKSFLKEILNFKNVPNFCYAVLYGDVSRSGEKNILTIFDEVSFTFQDILKNIKSLAKISPPKKIESDPVKMDDKMKGWLGIDYKKYTKTTDDKTTDDTKSTTNQYTGSGGSGSGWISINSKYDKEILQSLGKPGEKLTDEDIKDIYNKLKSAGKIK